MHILNGGIGSRIPSISTSRKPFSRDTENPMELYAWAVSTTEMPQDRGMLGRGKVDTDFLESSYAADRR